MNQGVNSSHMFKRRDDDYFLSIKCPQIREGQQCSVINCIFSHEISHENDPPKLKRSTSFDSDDQITHKIARVEPNAAIVSPNVPKKLSIDSVDCEVNSGSPKIAQSSSEICESVGAEQQSDDEDTYRILPREINHFDVPNEHRCRNIMKICEFYEDEDIQKCQADAMVEEHSIANKSHTELQYSENMRRFLNKKPLIEISDAKLVHPRELASKAPATLPERKRYIELLVAAHKSKNPHCRLPVSTSIAQEYEIASSTSSTTYAQAIKKKIYYVAHPEKIKASREKTLSQEEIWDALQKLVIKPETLKSFGYIMEAPAHVEPDPKRTCIRCGAVFALYASSLPKPVGCQFHEGKLRRRSKTVRAYDCCGAEQGSDSEPCKTCDHHVFMWQNAEERHAALPYHNTKDLFDADSYVLSKCLGIDCEMGYTTRGFELLRISAVDFMTGRDVFDVLVKPKGIVIDLNTRYSGVAKIEPHAVSFEKLMEVLGKHMNSNTILVGHGLENDMNAMRLIHEKIVDTAILYPKFKATPTFRYSLKDLAFTYLSRNIQGGEHDSREDSIAAIDLVKYFIGRDAESQMKP